MNRTSDKVIRYASVGLLLMCTTLLGCWERVAPIEVQQPVELRTYTVPAEYQEEIRRMLRSAMGTDENSIGRVTTGPGGTLVVVAQPRIQAGVQSILEELKDLKAPAPSPAAVKLSYWFLVGRPLDPARGALAYRDGKAPIRIEPALREIVTADGPTEFALIEHFELTSLEGAEMKGHSFRVHQRTARTGVSVWADTSISFLHGGNHFQGQVTLQPDQVTVLAQSGFGGRGHNHFPDLKNETLTLYYVMAADLEQ